MLILSYSLYGTGFWVNHCVVGKIFGANFTAIELQFLVILFFSTQDRTTLPTIEFAISVTAETIVVSGYSQLDFRPKKPLFGFSLVITKVVVGHVYSTGSRMDPLLFSRQT